MGQKRLRWHQRLTDLLMLLLGRDNPSDLPLYAGAVSCVRCGWCCRQSACAYGQWDRKRHQCEFLAKDGEIAYSCSIHDQIVARPGWQWHMDPAFGAGCCSSLNSDRRRIVSALNNARGHNVSGA